MYSFGFECPLLRGNKMNAEERLLEAGFKGIKYLTNYSYDAALIGVSENYEAVYDYELMIEWLMKEEGWSVEDAIEWIEYNTIRALPYMGQGAPIVVYPEDETEDKEESIKFIVKF